MSHLVAASPAGCFHDLVLDLRSRHLSARGRSCLGCRLAWRAAAHWALQSSWASSLGASFPWLPGRAARLALGGFLLPLHKLSTSRSPCPALLCSMPLTTEGEEVNQGVVGPGHRFGFFFSSVLTSYFLFLRTFVDASGVTVLSCVCIGC